MKNSSRRQFIVASSAGLAFSTLGAPANSASRSRIDSRIDLAMKKLANLGPNFSKLIDSSAGILMMPRIRRGGVGIGTSYGEGALLIGRAPVEYYSVASASFGLQFGIQRYSSAMFFTSENSLSSFRRNDGWTLGADLGYTMIDQGEVIDIDSNTYSDDVYGVIFGQEGLHFGVTLEGSKYSRIIR
ncbi:MAG: YSC84-related protein [Amylibacter sp.]|jgi:lipid-binding SYLF domain-containing protein|tara:strand:- start:54989 stop:55546 length:558 start_codon:yes stop_codon:yes gene_type:complete